MNNENMKNKNKKAPSKEEAPSNPMKKPREMISQMREAGKSGDPLGSYTGTSTDDDMKPSQDADDL
jgi:hypothetical protein